MQAYHQQKDIGRQVRAIRGEVQHLKKQASSLASAAEQLEQTALKFGDLENHVAVIQSEIESVSNALQHIYNSEIKLEFPSPQALPQQQHCKK